jgi:hypothetical protein
MDWRRTARPFHESVERSAPFFAGVERLSAMRARFEMCFVVKTLTNFRVIGRIMG